MKKNISLIRLLSLQLATIFIFLTIMGAFFIIKESIKTSTTKKEQIKENILNEKKKLLESEVEQVFEYIKIQESATIRLAKNKLLEETTLVHSLITNLHYSLSEINISKEEIEKTTINTIKEFNKASEQDFFLTTLNGISLHNPENPNLVGRSTFHIKDAHHTRVTNEEIGMVRLSQEGFLSTFWGDKKPFKQKVTFIKSLYPLPWYITSSLYLDEFKKTIQKSILKHIANLRFGGYSDNYFFVNTLDGYQVLSDGKVYDPAPNIWNMTDTNGRKVVQENSIIARKYPKGNFNYYIWQKLDGTPSSKVSFIKLIPNWNMFIGAGTSLDIIEKSIKQQEAEEDKFLKHRIKTIIIILLICLAVIAAMLTYLTKRVKNNISHFSTSFENATTKYQSISENEINFTEFQTIADKANSLIKKLKIEQNKTYYKASHDYLTNLPNRMLLIDRLKLAIQQAKRDKTKVGVLFLDLDHFKKINDTLGHDVGDEFLKLVASSLQKIIRSSDTLARIGGDEFIIIIPNITDTFAINESVERILDIINTPFTLQDRKLKVGGSIGVSIFPHDGKDSDTLLKNADIAMYEAKEDGRNNFKFFDKSMDIKIHESIQLENELKNAIKKDELELYYQPKVDIKSGIIVGAEALIRWNHPTRGIIYPDSFITLAEESGLIIPLGKWVIQKSCEQYNTWKSMGHTLKIAINISVKQLEDSAFLQILKDIIQKTKVPCHHIELEITESFAAHNEDNIQTIKELKNVGVDLAMDDFGTGYSSLSYLNNLPIDTIKIDRSFIMDMLKKSDKKALVEIIIQTAKILKMKTVAEGVENKEEVEELKSLGCNLYQGYFFAKPLPLKEFNKLLPALDK